MSENLFRRLRRPAPAKPSPVLPDAPATADLTRALHGVRRQLLELTGLVHQQSDFTVEALHRAGWQSDADASQQAALHKALRLVETKDPDVIVGPWTGDVGGWCVLADDTPSSLRQVLRLPSSRRRLRTHAVGLVKRLR